MTTRADFINAPAAALRSTLLFVAAATAAAIAVSMLSPTPLPQQAPPARQKRCRTGCLKCRARRRKCDETKPQCRNCTSKGFECRYASLVTFLEKNTFTCAVPEAPTTEPAQTSAPPTRYPNLRFINEKPNKEDNELSQEASSSSGTASGSATNVDFNIDSESSFEPDILRPNEVPDAAPLSPAFQQNISGPRDEEDDLNVALWTSNMSPQHQRQQREQESQDMAPPQENLQLVFGERYESAVHGLLALGTGHSSIARDTSTAATPPEIGTAGDEISTSTIRDEVSAEDPPSNNGMQHIPYTPSEHILDILCNLPQERIMELLRHFRYNVAPWLDICDMDQCFGITVPQVAMNCESVRFAVLALSAGSMNALGPLDTESRDLICLAEVYQNRRPPSDTFTSSIYATLRSVWDFLWNIPKTWEQALEYGLNFPDMDSSDLSYDSNLESSIRWLFLRLELSTALANSSPISKSNPMRYSIAQAHRSSDVSTWMFQYAHQPLLLCIKAAHLSSGEPDIFHDGPPPPRNNPVQNWRALLDELEMWYTNRTQEFHPVVDLEAGPGVDLGTDAAFPTIIFTSGAGIFSNQLYHTAMLLLLLNKPRTLKLTGNRWSISPLWHAERLCGIALNNDRRECWDPCLLASLLVAARRMTHESQQLALLDGFERIRLLTGFDIRDCLTILRDEWAPLEGII